MRRRPRTLLALAPAILALALLCAAGPFAGAAAAEPSWTTYHHDATRSGDDSETTGAVAPTLAWHSQELGAPIWSEPLVLGSRVYVATVGDEVYALEAATGTVAWQTSLGTPVPKSALPCGDISPTVGVVGTPVIDAGTGTLYAVADTWDGSKPHHELVALSIANGAVLHRTSVDPPAADPRALLQRTALNLDGGNVVFGFGGNDGDCSEYKGTLVSAPESGAAPTFWEVPVSAPSKAGGAIWSTPGPAVGPEGDVYTTTGNPVPPSGQQPGPYDYSDSVVQLSSSLQPLGSFEPPNWLQEGENDLDLSSAGPELLPGGLLFQAGKDGVGYLIDESTMAGKPGAAAVFSGQVCHGAGSFGGDSFAGGVIYVPCTNGVQALSYNQAARSFTPLWQGPSNAFGPPIVSAGLVWVAATGGFSGGGTTLYGLDPASGQPRYTLTLPSAIADHFATPSAAGGRLFIATGSSETAYTIGSTASVSSPPGAAPIPVATAPTAAHLLASRIPTLVHTRLRADRRGRVRVTLRCAALSGACSGTLALRAKFVRTVRVKHRRARRTTYVTLGRVRFDHGRGTFTITMRLGRAARSLLRRHHGRLAVQVIVSVAGARPRTLAASLSG